MLPESPGVTWADPLYDAECPEGVFYGVKIRSIASKILHAEADTLRDLWATGAPRGGTLEGRDHDLARRTGAHLSDVSTFVNDFLLLNFQIVSEIYEASADEPLITYFE